MKIVQKIAVPTGYIVVIEASKGLLEFLSIGDYGKPVNLNPDSPVPDNPPLLPLAVISQAHQTCYSSEAEPKTESVPLELAQRSCATSRKGVAYD